MLISKQFIHPVLVTHKLTIPIRMFASETNRASKHRTKIRFFLSLFYPALSHLSWVCIFRMKFILFVICRNKCGGRTILNIYTHMPSTELFFKQAFFATLVAFKLESSVLCTLYIVFVLCVYVSMFPCS